MICLHVLDLHNGHHIAAHKLDLAIWGHRHNRGTLIVLIRIRRLVHHVYVGENELRTVGARTTADELLTVFMLVLLFKMGARVYEDSGEDGEDEFSPVKKRGR